MQEIEVGVDQSVIQRSNIHQLAQICLRAQLKASGVSKVDHKGIHRGQFKTVREMINQIGLKKAKKQICEGTFTMP